MTIAKYTNSHSTMYLLKPQSALYLKRQLLSFTFHHVSIKTLVVIAVIILVVVFTFHHVSIKTVNAEKTIGVIYKFTFHHVSIKTK